MLKHSSLDLFSFQFKLINWYNNVSKDISFQRYLVLDILTNPERVTLTKKGNILGENPLLISLLTYEVQIWLLRMREQQKSCLITPG